MVFMGFFTLKNLNGNEFCAGGGICCCGFELSEDARTPSRATTHTYAHPFPWVALCLVQVTEHGNDRVQEVDVVRGRHVRFWCQGQVTGPRAVAASASLVAVSEWKLVRLLLSQAMHLATLTLLSVCRGARVLRDPVFIFIIGL
jgi:hypothetical protein